MVKARTAAKKLVLSSMLVALVVALSPIYFVWGPTKALPWQHIVNVIAGIVLGPLWAAAVAFLAGTIRIVLGTGTIFAYPGGIPSGLVVGLTYSLLSKTGDLFAHRAAGDLRARWNNNMVPSGPAPGRSFQGQARGLPVLCR
jgi:predicted membrane protein